MRIREAMVGCTLALTAPLAAMPAFAEPFIGGSLGQSDIDRSITTRLITSGSVDGKDTAFKLFSGYMFTPYAGIESAYVHLGDVTYSGQFDNQFGSQPVSGGKVDATGFTISLLGSYSLTQELSLLGKLGIFIWEWRASDTTSGQPFSTAEDGSDLSFGLGLRYSFARKWAVRAEWERFQLDDADADLLSIGLVWRF
ncbi:MAG TPA: porin family protein [Burkholderiales bacterium]|nr:porin family protein [Burkholderiales bacterium]